MRISNRTDVKERYRFYLVLVLALLMLLIQAGPAAAAPGVDGPMTITTSGVVVNRYAPVMAISGSTITVSDIDLLDDGAGNHYFNEDLSAGDMILIYQARGATFTDTSDTPTYGAFSYNGAGTYQFGSVIGVSGNDIIVDASNTGPYACGGITGNYDVAGDVQVVRVPQYTTLTIENGASVVAEDWNGSIGGVVAIAAQTSMTIDGAIDVSGQGFRGGVVDTFSTLPSTATHIYRSDDIDSGGEKGESILGYQDDYHTGTNEGRYGRGAPANGGGGGVNHNSGGGGGANGHNSGNWTGQGLPDTSNTSWGTAWDIDDGSVHGTLPGYFIGGAGGGRGGYSLAFEDLDALSVEPGNTAWLGDFHRNIGGLGGRPVSNDPNARLFFGGGGGAGDNNDDGGLSGGDGAGLIILITDVLGGGGQILANGDSVPHTLGPFYSDGNGGGGAGGTIVVKTNSITGVSVEADGGHGGDVDNGAGRACINSSGVEDCTNGPGGGGGGGYIHIDADSGSVVTLSVAGGANGINTSAYVDEFPPDGTTSGYPGATSMVGFIFPGCAIPTAISLLGISDISPRSTDVLLILLLVLVIVATMGAIGIKRNREKAEA